MNDNNLIKLKLVFDRTIKPRLKVSHQVDCKTPEQLDKYIKSKRFNPHSVADKTDLD